MAAFFFDSSAIIKRYVNERGSTFVESLTDLNGGNFILLARITRVEVIAAFARRLKSGSISIADSNSAVAAFRYDLTNNYFSVDITPILLGVAENLALKHALRGYDAVQLAAALEANGERIANELPPLTLVAADIELNSASIAEGLSVKDPNEES